MGGSDFHEGEEGLHRDPAATVLLEMLRYDRAELLEQWSVGVDASVHRVWEETPVSDNAETL